MNRWREQKVNFLTLSGKYLITFSWNGDYQENLQNLFNYYFFTKYT